MKEIKGYPIYHHPVMEEFLTHLSRLCRCTSQLVFGDAMHTDHPNSSCRFSDPSNKNLTNLCQLQEAKLTELSHSLCSWSQSFGGTWSSTEDMTIIITICSNGWMEFKLEDTCQKKWSTLNTQEGTRKSECLPKQRETFEHENKRSPSKMGFHLS